MDLTSIVSEAARDRLVRAPMPSWIPPMLATPTEERFDSPEWIYEHKFDGERGLAYVRDGEARLWSRNRHEIGASYPEIVAALRGSDDVVLDGEIVALDAGGVDRFELLQHRMQRPSAARERGGGIPVQYRVFDVLHVGDTSTLRVPLLDRKEILRRVVRFGDVIVAVEHRTPDGLAYLAEACRRGWEGVIAKRARAPYRPGRRSRDWLKFKCVADQEFVVGGFTDPKGSREGFGALLVGYHDESGGLRYAGKVGTGFDDATLRSLRAVLEGLERATPPFAPDPGLPRRGVHWVEPVLVVEIGFTEWTAAGRLRHPRFRGLRRDKAPEEVVRETPTSPRRRGG